MKNARELQDQIARLANASRPRSTRSPRRTRRRSSSAATSSDDESRRRARSERGGRRPGQGTFHAGAGVEDTVTRDADGKIIDTKKRGHNEGGLTGRGRQVPDRQRRSRRRPSRAGRRRRRAGRRCHARTRRDRHREVPRLAAGRRHEEEEQGQGRARDRDRRRGGGRDTSTRSQGHHASATPTSRRSRQGEERAPSGKTHASWGRDIEDWRTAASEDRQRPATTRTRSRKRWPSSSAATTCARRWCTDAVRGKAEASESRAMGVPGERLKTTKRLHGERRRGEREAVVAAGKKDKAKGEAIAKDLLDELERLDRHPQRDRLQGNDDKAEMKSTIASRITKMRDRRAQAPGRRRRRRPRRGRRSPSSERLFDDCITYQQTEDRAVREDRGREQEEATPTPTRSSSPALTARSRSCYASWTKEYEKMATFAQKNNRQKDHYFKFRPDTASVCSTSSRPARPGRRPARPPTRSDRSASRRRRCARPRAGEEPRIRPNWKKYNQIKDEIKSTGAEVTRLAHELKALFDKQPNAAGAEALQAGQRAGFRRRPYAGDPRPEPHAGRLCGRAGGDPESSSEGLRPPAQGESAVSSRLPPGRVTD